MPVPPAVSLAFASAYRASACEPESGMPNIRESVLASVLTFQPPTELVEWLCHANGGHHECGMLIGLLSEHGALDIIELFDIFPKWHENRWIPIASEGCGSYYVMEATSPDDCPVYFVDHEDYEALRYVAASDLWHFLEFLFVNWTHDCDSTDRWPFASEYVLERDPELGRKDWKAPLPWEA